MWHSLHTIIYFASQFVYLGHVKVLIKRSLKCRHMMGIVICAIDLHVQGIDWSNSFVLLT